MKIGPVHVVKDATMAWMQAALHRFSSCLANSNQELERISQLLAETTDERDRLLRLVADANVQAHRLQHHPAFARLAPVWMLEPDADDQRSRCAVERVAAAYRRAMAAQTMRDAGMWIHAERRNSAFIAALESGNAKAVRNQLASLFQSGLINGLGRFHENMAVQIRASACTPIQLQFIDALVSLAEAFGVARVTSFEQDAKAHAHALDRDPDALLKRIEARSQLRLDFPRIGGAYGCTAAGRHLAIDSLIHGYTVQRLRELETRSDWRFVEIGGGYGCLAELMHRHGFTNYAIYDLPWVNAIQGYFLILALPEKSVQLFGEPPAELAVLPFWEFFDLPAQAADMVINTDSLPEMGAAIAASYIESIANVARKFFFSINQEAKADVEAFGPQQCVAEIVERTGGLRPVSRQRYWMRPGYVEELFIPSGNSGS